MSKHERQHSTSHVVDTRISEVKRARVENAPFTYSNQTDKNGTNELPISDEKKSLE
jgi:hypothetical protein